MSSKNNLTLQSFQACWSLTEQILRSAVVSRDQINENMLPQWGSQISRNIFYYKWCWVQQRTSTVNTTVTRLCKNKDGGCQLLDYRTNKQTFCFFFTFDFPLLLQTRSKIQRYLDHLEQDVNECVNRHCIVNEGLNRINQLDSKQQTNFDQIHAAVQEPLHYPHLRNHHVVVSGILVSIRQQTQPPTLS